MSEQVVKRYVSTRLLPDASTWNVSGAAHTYVHISDYAALEAENARLERLVSHWQGLALMNRKVADDALAQLAAIQGGMGEVLCAELKACAAGRREDSPHTAHLMDRAAHAIAAMAAEVERLSRMLNNATNDGIKLADERDALSAQLRDANNLADQWAEKIAALSAQQSAPDRVSVPVELLQDLHDLASDAVEHHRAAFAGYKLKRQANMEDVVDKARAILASHGRGEA